MAQLNKEVQRNAARLRRALMRACTIVFGDPERILHTKFEKRRLKKVLTRICIHAQHLGWM